MAATTARRGLRRDQDPLSPRRLVVTTGEPAGIGPDIALAAALADWPCELVFAGDPELLAARAARLSLPLRPSTWREGAEPVPHRAGTLPKVLQGAYHARMAERHEYVVVQPAADAATAERDLLRGAAYFIRLMTSGVPARASAMVKATLPAKARRRA